MSATSFCLGCSAPTTSLTEICPQCGARVGKPISARTWKPVVAGILSIVAGGIGILSGMGFSVYPLFWEDIGFGVALYMIGLVAIMGGIFALRRRVWGLALTGAICALFPGMLILGILAIVFTALSKEEFE